MTDPTLLTSASNFSTSRRQMLRTRSPHESHTSDGVDAHSGARSKAAQIPWRPPSVATWRVNNRPMWIVSSRWCMCAAASTSGGGGRRPGPAPAW